MVAPPAAVAEADLEGPAAAEDRVFPPALPDFCGGSVFASVEGRAAEKALPVLQPVDAELFISEPGSLDVAGRLFPLLPD